MRYGLLADVHGNLAALQTSLAFLEREGVDAYLCPGDVVGYGPQPNECVEALAARPVHCVAGNHDLMATGQLTSESAGPLVRRTLAWTQAVLDPSARSWLERLPLRTTVPGAVVAHGALDDPRTYVVTDRQAARQLAQLGREHRGARVLVLGHTHRPAAFGDRSGRVTALRIRLAAGERWMLNPGAVGQSRQRDIRACVAVLDLERDAVAFHALTYDVAATLAELRRHGLPAAAVHLPPPRGPRRLIRHVARLARRGG